MSGQKVVLITDHYPALDNLRLDCFRGKVFRRSPFTPFPLPYLVSPITLYPLFEQWEGNVFSGAACTP
jgi:hypothetical protein